MADQSSIEWTDSTFNPWIGCTKVGPGCDHCYAERDMDHRRGRARWGAGQPRSRTSVDYWRQPFRWERQAAAFFAEHGRRRRVFCASLADVFDNEVDPEWRRDLFNVISGTPSLDWLLLTKRIGIAQRLFDECHPDGARAWPENVWLGATVVNQEEVERDVPKLLRIPARVRFLSIEPMLGPVDLIYPDRLFPEGPARCCDGRECGCMGQPIDPPLIYGIHWVICGGESGPGARPMHPDWARSLRDQCAGADVPFLFKQWGNWAPVVYRDQHGARLVELASTKNSTVVGDPLRPSTLVNLLRMSKKAAGRLLDGVQHDEFPA